jgi:uncharacterized protein (DUF1330 family)
MPKGYWIAHVTVDDPQAYEEYRARNGAAFAKYGGKFLVRGGRHETPEGSLRPRHVVIEFPSYEAALACYRSPEYVEASKYRLPVSKGDFVVIEGYDGPQP